MEDLLTRIKRRLLHPFSTHNRMYYFPDPYRMASEKEQYRFRETNAIIEGSVGHVGSLLEFGSGEGYQTEYLLKVADEVYGVEKSSVAAKRARPRAPKAAFFVGTVEKTFDRRFDVVTAFELLYYLPEKDMPRILKHLEELAPVVVVSYWRDRNKEHWLDKYFAHEKVHRSIISRPQDAGMVWDVRWWKTETRVLS